MKKWYIIQDNHHLGPYSDRNLIEMYEQGKVFAESEIWHDELEEPTNYKLEFMSMFEEKSEPEVIDLSSFKKKGKKKKYMIKEVSEEAETIEQNQKENELDSALSELDEIELEDQSEKVIEEIELSDYDSSNPLDLPKVKRSQKFNYNGGELDLHLDKINPKKFVKKKLEETSDSPSFQKWKKYCLVSLGSLVSIFFIYLFVDYYLLFVRGSDKHSDISQVDNMRLKKVSLDKSSESLFSFSLAKDKEQIVVSTNNPYQGEILARFKSVPGQVLRNNEIEFQTIGKLERKQIVFNEFNFTKGERIVDGYYDVQIISLNSLKKSIVGKFLGKQEPTFEYFDRVFVSSLSIQAFTKVHQSKQMKELRNESKFKMAISEKYKTISAISKQILDEIKKIDSKNGKDRWDESVEKFEQTYTASFGQLFTSFIIENERSFEELNKKEFQDKSLILNEYTELSSKAKNLGQTVMDVLDEYKFSSPSEEGFSDMVIKSIEKIEAFGISCDEKAMEFSAK